MAKIKAVIFDLDGTLANTLPLCVAAFKKSIEPLINRSVSEKEIIATFGPSEEGTIMALIPNHYDKGLRDYLYYYELMHLQYPKPFEGIEKLLKTLKRQHVRVAMVTGKGKHSTAISLKQFNLIHFFEFIETGLPGGPRKTEGIENIVAFFPDIRKDEILYIGDAPSDIIASRKAGVKVIAAAWAETAEPEKLKELTPDRIFYRVPDFADWLYEQI